MRPSARWTSLVTYYAERVSLDPAIVYRQMLRESSGNPHAISPAGAKGLMQLMPGACQDMNVHSPFDPDQNVKGGTEYLARQLANVRLTAKDAALTPTDALRLALASYNAGFGYVRATMKECLAQQLPLTWPNIKSLLRTVTARGLKVDWKQVTEYVDAILPLTEGTHA